MIDSYATMLEMMKWLPLEEACVRIEEGPYTRSGSELLHCKSSKYRISISSQLSHAFISASKSENTMPISIGFQVVHTSKCQFATTSETLVLFSIAAPPFFVPVEIIHPVLCQRGFFRMNKQRRI